MTLPYSVIIKHNGRKRRLSGFRRMDELELLVLFIKEECPFVQMHVVNHKTPTPKPKDQRVRGKLWCPYCGSWQTFIKWADYKKCPVCHISTEDFHTKTENGLWPRVSEYESKSTKRKKRRAMA